MSRYILKRGVGPTSRIYATNGQWYAPLFIGPGGRSARIWGTRAGAERAARFRAAAVVEVTQ